MSYSKANLRYTDEVIAKRKSDAEMIQRERQIQVIRKIPEIGRYLKELSGLASGLLRSMESDDFESMMREITDTNQKAQRKIRSLLVENGYPEDYLDTPYTCPECGDSGFVNGYACSCRKELLSELNVRDLEAVSPARNCRFDNFSLGYYSDISDAQYGVSPREKMEDILEYCKAYAADFDMNSNSVYMCGAPGLGKTHLSLAIANVAARKGYSVVYYSAQNLLSDIEREKFSGARPHTESKALGCDLLIIDDLGSEFSTQFTVSQIYNILNDRINRSKPVIISTNLSPEELEKKYTQRITSRIIGNYTPLFFMGSDIRQIKSAE
ncbi:MAG: ATP-binding protein [Clostridia bacterium]|nr:ATP-binding protein [Clostridia bacterium]